ncbi:polyprenyl synthetase family protein [Nonomuraea thailandensis]
MLLGLARRRRRRLRGDHQRRRRPGAVPRRAAHPRRHHGRQPAPPRAGHRAQESDGPAPGPGAEAFGRAGGILLGTLSLAWSDALLSSCGVEAARLRAAHHLFDAMRTEVISGQYLDVLAQLRSGATEAEALTVIRYKSAKYTVERPLQIGGALAGASPELLEAYSRFGVPLGEAFQLRDDVLGTFGSSSETGKSALDDLREGKQTVMYAYAVQNASPRSSAT